MTGWSHKGPGDGQHHARPAEEKTGEKAGDKAAPGAGPRGFGGPPSPARLFEHADKNKDGKLTKDEVPEFMWTRLSNADADKDGSVTKSELEEHHKKMSAAGEHGPGGHAFGGPGFGGRGPGAGRPGFGRPGFGGPRFGGHPSAEFLLEHADKNKDGKLTKDELPERAWEHLSTADTDKDGAVSKAELEAHIKKQHDAGKPGADKPAADKPAEKATDKADDKPAEKPAETKTEGSGS